MRLIAFYLPQFHEIPENDLWWGKGYTDWTSVKKAVPIRKTHIQPREPLHDNYYDLMEKSTMEWQSKLSLKAGLEGFCFYHYWFKGRKILEKPVENYLKWTDIKQNFCLSWANESWIRTWSNVNVEGNSWNDGMNVGKKKGKQVAYLLKQEYGNKKDWKEHFDYLLPFFKDYRYIKVGNKPIFIIYKPLQIKCLNPMLKYWNELAREAGLEGIYTIATNVNGNLGTYIDAKLMYEPAYTLDYDKPYLYRKRDQYINKCRESGKKKHQIKTYSYDWFYHKILGRKVKDKVPVYRGLFVDFDDTPRRGEKGIYFKGVTHKKFYRYLRSLCKKMKNRNDFLFITAWNEWGEGAYLEPDKNRRYDYLREIRKCRLEIANDRNNSISPATVSLYTRE